MKTSLLAVSLLTFAAGAAVADKVRDWHDLDKVHAHVLESIHEMERARAANPAARARHQRDLLDACSRHHVSPVEQSRCRGADS